MFSTALRPLAVLLVAATLVNVVSADDASFLAAMRNLIFGQQQQNQTTPLPEDATPRKALHPGHYPLQPQMPPMSQYPQQQPVYGNYQPAAGQFSPSNVVSSGSACQLPQQIGTGPYRIPRWYFNPSRMRCELFYWSGCCGNSNNFQTFQACQQTCEESGNTVILNSPPVIAQNTPSQVACCLLPYTTGYGDYQIPRWYFEPSTGSCHLYLFRGAGEGGNSFRSAEECRCICSACSAPKMTNIVVVLPPPLPTIAKVDPCSQDQDQGVGALQQPRFFFNHKTKLCEQFIYFGSGGNRNNFVSLEECQKTCPETPNPCAYGSSSVTQCAPGSSLVTTCTGNQFCHVGATPTTTVCCNKPALGDRCSQPLNVGVGNANLQRWYFNPLTQQCQTCTYKGLQGNENNFMTQQECQNACVVNPCARGMPYRSKGMIAQCSAANQAVCPAGYYCHVGATQQTSVCCQALAHAVSSSFDVCDLPKSRGTGRSLQKRFYYNASLKRCETFVYGGKEGNANNFMTLEQCKDTCYSENSNSCPVGLAIREHNTELLQCELTLDCPSRSFCHKSDSLTPGICCPASDVHPCLQTHSLIGRGFSNITRWTYDQETFQCVAFEYSGAKGNANNFASAQECEEACPTFPNPCPFGRPLINTAESTLPYPISCSSGKDCPGDSWCHHGPANSTSVCCPGDGDPCAVPVNQGYGSERLRRYGYDMKMRQCIEFEYFGSRGNMNNFMTKESCEMECSDFVNPCDSEKHPEKDANGDIKRCYENNVCGPNFRCTNGLNPTSTVCCPVVSDPCSEAMSKGEGSLSLTRFYFDSVKSRCFAFNYFGTKGNTNNFMTKDDCEKRCPIWVNPCANGAPLEGPQGMPQRCQHRGACPMNYYCHIGYEDSTTVCCPSKTKDPCHEPMNAGNGGFSMARWFYNAQSRKCQQFSYSGYGGNENNFLLREHCEDACPVWENPCPMGEPIIAPNNRPQQCAPGNTGSCPSTHWCHPGVEPSSTVCCPGRQDPCVLVKSEGEGKFQQQRFFFDLREKQCLPFIFKGVKGNANNFLTKKDCEAICPVWVNPCPMPQPQNHHSFSSLKIRISIVKCSKENTMCPDSYWCHIGNRPETSICCPNAGNPCTQPARLAGTGDYTITRWTYDAKSRTCVPFDYHGFKGNQNNFLNREDCEQRCPTYDNPCKTGQPFLINNRPQMCNPLSPCPNSYYCHIGANDQAMCCPVQGGDPCGQPMDRGRGSSQLQRWYWDMAQQRCLPFNYCGQKGTQNNFLSQQDCERTCYEMDNPCALGNPQLGTNNRPLQCSLESNVCGPSFWCHIGALPQTTVCCPGRVPEPQVCQQPMAPGSGDASLQRWFYDAFQKRCVQFVYKGRYGNQNNFLSQQACEGACNVYVNVCPYGEPLLEGNRPKPCTFGSDSCGPNHWCHLGLVPDEYQCCPGEPRNPAACNGLPSAVGVPGAPSPPATRWFFDTTDKTCKEFQYQGRKGNQNNFLTQEDCTKTCDVFVNPCNLPINMPPQSCSPTANTCSAGSWCHIGETPSTTICCPSEGDPCLLPQARGTGFGFLDRWYYDASTGSCQPFTYTGLHGNQNNFLSRMECEQTCAPNPCAEGNPFMGIDGRAQTCSASANMNTCPSGYWCHIGAATPTTVCCPGASQNICNLPMSTGEGNSNLERYYFDSITKTCRPFTYGGLKGNQNNFLSLRACQLSCQPLDNPCIGQPATTAAGQILFCSATNKDTCPVNFWCHLGATPETTVCCPGATNPCSVPLAPGTGNSNLARWYYNADDRECQPFEYNGKRGNQNNFETQNECARTCPVFENPCMGEVEKLDGEPRQCSPIRRDSCGRGHFCLGVEGNVLGDSGYCCPSMGDPCNTYLNEGEGLKQLPRWYFNPRTQQCHPFTYRGRKGNENNFLSQRTCEERCQPIANACFAGDEPLRREGRIVQCQHNSGCPHSHYCHQGASPRSSVCCKKSGDVCDQQLMAGIGDVSLARFYYSHAEDDCLPFNYTGLGGNENNFRSKQECLLACPGFKGYCPHGKPLLKKGKMQTCGIDTICPKNYLCHVTRKEMKSVCCSDPAHFCLMEKDPGPCDQKLLKFAYNRTLGICQKFEYGGCSGNLNNFDSLESCTEVCCDKGYY